jgi:ubiquinone/menaquinone biosynthesis C-methylase UbiE
MHARTIALFAAFLCALPLATRADLHENHHAHDPHEAHKHRERSAEEEKANREYDEARAAWQRDFAQSADFSPGMIVADLGAGDGDLTVLLAEHVGPDGHVFANEIDEAKISRIEHLCGHAGVGNVTTVLGQAGDPVLPPGRVDVAVMVEVFHHLTNHLEFLKATFRELKAGGKLIIVEPDVRQEGGNPEGCYADPHESRKVAEEAGFEFERFDWFDIEDFEHFSLVVRKPEPLG